MFRAMALGCALLAATAAGAQTLVHEWDFGHGIGEWYTAHSAEALAHEDGALVIRVNGGDPYIHCGRGDCLDLAANERQFIRIRLRSNTEGGASFYYCDTTEGRDAGFVAEKHAGFFVPGDDEWHDIDVYPGWTDRVTRLRLDPPGNEPGSVTRVERIAVYEWPISPQTGNLRDLAQDHANWLPRGGASLGQTAEGMRVAGQRPTLSTTFPDAAPGDGWLTVEGQADRSGVLTVMWTDADDRPCRVSQSFAPERTRVAFRLADGGGPPTAEKPVRLEVTFGEPPGAVILRRTTLGEKPVGPAVLDVLSATLDRAAAVVGEPVGLRLVLQNSGGEPLPASDIPVSPAGGRSLTHAALQPGERVEIEATQTFSQMGAQALRVGPEGAARDLTVLISDAPAEDVPQGAAVRAGTASLVGEAIRLRAGAVGEGRYGPLWLELRERDEWRRVAVLPAIGRLMPGPTEHCAMDSALAQARGKTLVFSESCRDDGGRTWSARATYRIAADNRIEVEHRLTVDRDGDLYHFSGPWLWAGDATCGGRKREAIFPGLEYLGTDVADQEASSSDRDIRAPGDLRLVPDRHKITIPLQAVTLPNRDLVALLWRNEADGTGPASIFASPNFAAEGDTRLQGFTPRSTANHLLGLFLPLVPENVPENAIIAQTPMPVKAGEPVLIRSQIMARPNAEVLDAVSEWIALYKPPSAGKVADLFEQTLRLSGDFYLNEYGAKQRDASSIAVQCLYLAHRLDDPGLRELAGQAPGPSDNLAQALHFGGIPEALWSQALTGRNNLDGRTPEGTWVFEPDEARSVLGPRGETNAGIIAPPLTAVLQAARATADEAMLQEALVSLEHLRKFRVPRGAQVWEVPLHCPDILASGRACDAFTLAYQLTGDATYLEDARYWAATARPFIYHWQHPREDLRPMRGGSIPVFGASMFTNAWFGRLVQWNGMAVARSLHELARAGGGDEWAQVAEDLTVSGQRQQIADPDNPDYGRYPDYWNMRTGIPGYWLSPGLLLTVTLERSGYTPDGDWRVLRSGGKLISIGSPTPLRSPRAGEQPLGRVVTDVEVPFDLSFTVDYPLGPTSCVAIVGIAEPQQVTVRGRELNRSDGPAEGESWQYVEDFAAVVLSLRHADASPVPVVVRSLEPADPPNVLDRREWDFSQGLFGWGAAPNAVRVEHRDGRLVAEALGGDPYFSGPRLALPSEEIERISIRARGTAAGTFQVFWANDDGGYAPERSTTTSALPADGEFHIVTADVSGRAQWKGMLRSLRLDPPGGEGSATEIDWIQLGPWLP